MLNMFCGSPRSFPNTFVSGWWKNIAARVTKNSSRGIRWSAKSVGYTAPNNQADGGQQNICIPWVCECPKQLIDKKLNGFPHLRLFRFKFIVYSYCAIRHCSCDPFSPVWLNRYPWFLQVDFAVERKATESSCPLVWAHPAESNTCPGEHGSDQNQHAYAFS